MNYKKYTYWVFPPILALFCSVILTSSRWLILLNRAESPSAKLAVEQRGLFLIVHLFQSSDDDEEDFDFFLVFSILFREFPLVLCQ